MGPHHTLPSVLRTLCGLAVCSLLVGTTGSLAAHATSVSQAQSSVNSATSTAQKTDAALSQTQKLLQATQAQLAALGSQIAQLNAQIAADQAKVASIDQQMQQQEYLLSNLAKAAYESGTSANFLYLMESSSLSQAVDRTVNVSNMMDLNQSIATKIASERKQAVAALAAAQTAQATVKAKAAQAITAQLLLQEQEQKLQQQDRAAWKQVQQAQTALTAAIAAQLPKPPPPPPPPPPVPPTYSITGSELFLPISTSTNPFTVLTNLTLPSGETAAELNAFLQGTDLAGLGQYFIQAEQQYHVSARYFLAHAIEESGWGTSPLAQTKHNLFGYDAYDANPYVDGMTFTSDGDCILYVAQQIATNYLSPTGQFYHGPTLLGMNVDYATDPNWASNIATIANSIPLPSSQATSGAGS